MNDATPNEVSTRFAFAIALPSSAIAAPFVPDAILACTAYCCLRHFNLQLAHLKGAGELPLHLGCQSHRDETTRRHGDANWPLGLAAAGQFWLRREDLVQGLSINGENRSGRRRRTAAQPQVPASIE